MDYPQLILSFLSAILSVVAWIKTKQRNGPNQKLYAFFAIGWTLLLIFRIITDIMK